MIRKPVVVAGFSLRKWIQPKGLPIQADLKVCTTEPSYVVQVFRPDNGQAW